MKENEKLSKEKKQPEGKTTDRENELISILMEDPMISQADIAEKMGITRSSVSVYITNLIRKGIIRGRGYIFEKEKFPVVIGTANFDYIGTASHYRFGDAGQTVVGENADLHVSYAGFAKNVSEILNRLGCSPVPIFVVGNDVFGNELIHEMKYNDINTDNAVILDGASTAMYMELRDGDNGDVLVRLSDLKILDAITPQFLQSKHRILRNAGILAIEDDLKTDSVAWLTMNYPGIPVFFLANDSERTLRFREYYRHFQLMTLSLEIAQAITENEEPVKPVMPSQNEKPDTPAPEGNAIVDIAKKILAKGPQSILIPFSQTKICYAQGNTCYFVTDTSMEGFHFSYGMIRMPVFAAAVYCENEKMTLLDKLNYIAAARAVAVHTYSVSNYHVKSVCSTAIQDELRKGNYEIRTVSF